MPGDFNAIIQALRCGNARCECAKQRTPSKVRVHCPVHAPDEHPSLDITRAANGIPLFQCRSQHCKNADIIEALRSRGLWTDARQKWHETTYTYTDASGRPLHRVIRREPVDRGLDKPKRLFQHHLEGDRWVKGGPPHPVLYRLPELRAAPPSEPVFLCEGERNTDDVRGVGLVATTNSMGALVWRPEYNAEFAGRLVAILVDNDADGRERARRRAPELTAVGATVKVLVLPGLGPKEDVSDWLRRGGTKEQLLALMDETLIWTPPPVGDGEALASAETSLSLDPPEPGGPEVTRRGDAFLYTWYGYGIGIGIDQLREHSDSLSGEVTVETTMGGTLHWGRLGLASTAAREALVKKLCQVRDDVPWRELLERVCRSVTTTWRVGEPVVLVQPRPRATVRSLIEPALVLEDETSVVYGDGGAGKSAFAAALAAVVATGRALPGGIRSTRAGPGPVLYLDYEDVEETLAERLHGLQVGMGFPAIDLVHYRRMTRPLASDIEVVRVEVDRIGAVLVIVDSITPAAGPEPESADAATRTLNALRTLKVAKLFIAHLSKVEAQSSRGASRPWGSAFYWNLARSAWEFRRAADADEGPVPVALYHRKANHSRRHQPIGLSFEFADDGSSWVIRPGNLDESPDLIARTSLSHQIRTLLTSRGKITTKEAAEELGSSEDVIRKTLNRERTKGKIIVFPGPDGKTKLWGLKSHQEGA